MKSRATIAVLTLCVAIHGPVHAQSSTPGACQQKEQAILKELDIAKQYNNQGKIRGLETALEKVRTWCTDEGLLTKATTRIEEKQQKVREREKELAETRAEGKGSDAVAKRERKLAEAKEELNQAVRERDTLLKSIHEAQE